MSDTEHYRTFLTDAGLDAIGQAIGTGTALNLSTAILSSSAAAAAQDATEIVDEVWRGALSHLAPDAENPEWLVATVVLPEEAGGFWIRSFGLMDDAGRVLVAGTVPDIYKPVSGSGAAKAVTLRIVFLVGNAQQAAVFRCDSALSVAMHDALARARDQILTDASLTGAPTAPTPDEGDESRRIATTEFVARAQSSAQQAVDGALDAINDASRDMQAQFAQLAPLASPGLTGTPTAPTPADEDESGRIATTEFVARALVRAASLVPINHIGAPGEIGFGVGIAPDLPEGFTPLPGHGDPFSANYGNYDYGGGVAQMVWIPAFYYRWGNGNNGLGCNAILIRPFDAFASVEAARAAGFALHRAFFDGGQVKSGFFIDKYHACNVGGVAGAVYGGAPLLCYTSTNLAYHPLSELGAGIAGNVGGIFAAAKTRGNRFSPASGFMRGALSLLAWAQAASARRAACGWCDATNNFPKGATNGLVDSYDAGVTYAVADISGIPRNGAITGFCATTHNGQDCGVADLSSAIQEAAPALVVLGESYRILSIDTAIASLTGGNSTDTDYFNSAVASTLFDELGATYEGLRANTNAYGANLTSAGACLYASALEGIDWNAAGAGVPQMVATPSTSSYAHSGFLTVTSPRSEEAISTFASTVAASARLWSLSTANVRTTSSYRIGFRCGCYFE